MFMIYSNKSKLCLFFFPFLTSLNSLVNVLMISAFCLLSNISLLTTPGQQNETLALFHNRN